MTALKISPAPWNANFKHWATETVAIEDANDDLVAMAYFNKHGTNGRRANALMLAHAPDMHAALVAILALPCAQAALKVLDRGIGTQTDAKAWLMARDAVKRAEGAIP